MQILFRNEGYSEKEAKRIVDEKLSSYKDLGEVVMSSVAFANGGLADIPRDGYRFGGILQKAGSAMKNLKNNIMTKLSRMT